MVGILVGTNCVPLIADLFLFYYGRYLWPLFLIIKNLNIDNTYFEGMVGRFMHLNYN